MLVPYDKILNKKNDIIQLIITRSCDIFKCSNCTQLLPFRKDAMHMSLECVEKALILQKGWPGVTACFGGNPSSHPQFIEICELFRKHIPNPRQRGLWTNNLLSEEKAQAASATFVDGVSRFNFNLHGNDRAVPLFKKYFPKQPLYGLKGPSQHGQILGHYTDYGLTQEQWVAERERCDINQNWSGAIREVDGQPYVYFCEVAASIDGVRNTNNGLPMVQGWWQLPIGVFDGQIKNCCDKGCVVPLRLKGHADQDDTYDISKSWEGQIDNKKQLVQLNVNLSDKDKAKELTDYERLRGN